MLKGTLDGIVLAILATGGAYGYQITARLREMGFADTAEGTVYALLVRLEKRRSEEHTSELQSRGHLVCRLLLEKKKEAVSLILTSRTRSRRVYNGAHA